MKPLLAVSVLMVLNAISAHAQPSCRRGRGRLLQTCRRLGEGIGRPLLWHSAHRSQHLGAMKEASSALALVDRGFYDAA